MVHDSYQVVIIGAGPAGVACARELSALEVDYVIGDSQSLSFVHTNQCGIEHVHSLWLNTLTL
jgi:cation diffusion facilitator CzcD-associated flavoprotein CzcO